VHSTLVNFIRAFLYIYVTSSSQTQELACFRPSHQTHERETNQLREELGGFEARKGGERVKVVALASIHVLE